MKKGPFAMLKRLFTADRELRLAREEADRELEARRQRKAECRARGREDLDSTIEIMSTIKPANVPEAE